MATRVRVDINRAALQRVAATGAGRLVLSTTRRVLNRAKILTPVDTGTLRASQTMEVRTTGSASTGRVSTWINYALAVHEGVNHPVVIRPKRAKALRFVINGRVVYARKVTLPPRSGRPWLRTALVEVAVPAGFVVTRL
jgi:hypothetical protein